MKHVLDDIKAAVLRKHRNRRRNARAKLDRAHVEPPMPYRRVLRLRDRTGPRETFAGDVNRRARRSLGWRPKGRRWGRRRGVKVGSRTAAACARARGERRRLRAHRRRMAAR